MGIATQIKKDNALFALRQKCISEYKSQLLNQGVYIQCDTLVNNLFGGKGVNECKRWLKTNDALQAIHTKYKA